MSKYRAVKTVVDNITFDSKLEAKRYGELRLLEKGKQIFSLTIKPKYPLLVNGVKVADYIADFSYYTSFGALGGIPTVEDTKGVLTPVYRLKKKLVKALYGIDIQEIRK